MQLPDSPPRGLPAALTCARPAQALSNDGSGVTALTERLRNEALRAVTGFGQSLALRCLALACKAMPPGSSQVRARTRPAV